MWGWISFGLMASAWGASLETEKHESVSHSENSSQLKVGSFSDFYPAFDSLTEIRDAQAQAEPIFDSAGGLALGTASPVCAGSWGGGANSDWLLTAAHVINGRKEVFVRGAKYKVAMFDVARDFALLEAKGRAPGHCRPLDCSVPKLSSGYDTDSVNQTYGSWVDDRIKQIRFDLYSPSRGRSVLSELNSVLAYSVEKGIPGHEGAERLMLAAFPAEPGNSGGALVGLFQQKKLISACEPGTESCPAVSAPEERIVALSLSMDPDRRQVVLLPGNVVCERLKKDLPTFPADKTWDRVFLNDGVWFKDARVLLVRQDVRGGNRTTIGTGSGRDGGTGSGRDGGTGSGRDGSAFGAAGYLGLSPAQHALPSGLLVDDDFYLSWNDEWAEYESPTPQFLKTIRSRPADSAVYVDSAGNYCLQGSLKGLPSLVGKEGQKVPGFKEYHDGDQRCWEWNSLARIVQKQGKADPVQVLSPFNMSKICERVSDSAWETTLNLSVDQMLFVKKISGQSPLNSQYSLKIVPQPARKDACHEGRDRPLRMEGHPNLELSGLRVWRGPNFELTFTRSGGVRQLYFPKDRSKLVLYSGPATFLKDHP